MVGFLTNLHLQPGLIWPAFLTTPQMTPTWTNIEFPFWLHQIELTSISSAYETFHFPEAFLLFISSSDLPRGVGLCLFPVTSLKRIHWIPLVITPNSTYISSGLTNLNWKWKDIDQSVQKSEVLEKIPFHFDINLFSERLGQFFFR